MPEAPLARHALAFARVTPPSASTGIFALHASPSAARPWGVAPGTSFFSKTGAKTAKLTPLASACFTSAGEWHDTPISGARGAIPAGAPARHFVQTFRTS